MWTVHSVFIQLLHGKKKFVQSPNGIIPNVLVTHKQRIEITIWKAKKKHTGTRQLIFDFIQFLKLYGVLSAQSYLVG